MIMNIKDDIEFLQELRDTIDAYLFLGFAPSSGSPGYDRAIRDMEETLKKPEYLEMRKWISEAKPRALLLFKDNHIPATLEQHMPPMSGGGVLRFNILDLVTENLSWQRLPKEKVFDVIDQTIGALKLKISKNDLTTDPPMGSEPEPTKMSHHGMPDGNPRDVFVVHGRNVALRDAMFSFLRAIELHPIEWIEAVTATGSASPYVGQVLDTAFARARAVVVMLSPDDEARLREPYRSSGDPAHETELTGQARPNVIFEAGMAMGRNADRTLLVEFGTLRPFSDVGGRHVIRLDNSILRRQEFALRLKSVGCAVNLTGTDWHKSGNFDIHE